MKRSNTKKPVARPRRPQKYSTELKVSIARRVIEEGKSQAELSRETKISTTNIYKWVQQARRGELAEYVVPAFDAQTGDVTAEVRRLTRALAEMTAQRDFLKKTAIFFAKDRT